MTNPIHPAGGDWQREANALRTAGYSFPGSFNAKLQARQRVDAGARQRGTAIDALNRRAAADMNRRRISGSRGATMGQTRTASDMTLALPKVRQPLGSLMEKGIPWNVNDPKDLLELRRWCRLFYSTHDLVPLLIDIYSKFPVTGLEFSSKDPLIEKFYTEMFLNDLNYEEFLPDSIGREYFVTGEVTTLAHFNEQLGIWSSEEVLNPDNVAVSKSLFVDEERVQLLVKDLVEALRDGPQGKTDSEERLSERLERNFEYQQLVKNYPEIIQAAARDDGLDIADALVSRIVNRANPWDLRGTPFLLRSFRTLMMEEELNAAQDAVAGRLYSPLLLFTMGIDNMGNDEPWIPGQAELDDLRDDIQTALSADFHVLVHNQGVKAESVFGRESVPDFGNDYDRIDAKLMQAWGIGQALIMGGTGAGGAYASSALNREVCEQLMMGFQKRIVRHMIKRMEIIAEAQEHYDYELKGGQRVPLYREVVIEEENGDKHIERVPKLLTPEIHFATLNLRDETQERQFYMELKQAGVPVSDKFLAVNVKVDFEQELEREAQETVDKAMAKAQSWKVVQDKCDMEGLPYPEELVSHLTATLTLRQQLAATKQAEDQTKMLDAQAQQASPAGQTGALPGSSPMPGAPGAPPPGAGGPQAAPGDDMGSQASPPATDGPSGGGDPDAASGSAEPARNFGAQRPEESDEMSGTAPRAASNSPAGRWAARVHQDRKLTPFEIGPSSVGRRARVQPQDVEAAVKRREMFARHRGRPMVSQLIKDPDFWRICNATADKHIITADWPEIRNGGASDSARMLRDLVAQYEEVTGVEPVWD
jgi:hypothetical protein